MTLLIRQRKKVDTRSKEGTGCTSLEPKDHRQPEGKRGLKDISSTNINGALNCGQQKLARQKQLQLLRPQIPFSP